MRTTAAIVLAAGESRRMGALKPLLPFGGSTVLGTVVTTLAQLAPCLASCTVVLGHRAGEIAASLQALALPAGWLRLTLNPDARDGGMLSSVQHGLRAALTPPSEGGDRGLTPGAVLISLGDQPEVAAPTIAALLDAHQGGITLPSYGTKTGHPLLLDQCFFSEVLSLPSGQTLRDLVQRHSDTIVRVPVGADSVLRDLDTPDDYQRAIRAR